MVSGRDYSTLGAMVYPMANPPWSHPRAHDRRKKDKTRRKLRKIYSQRAVMEPSVQLLFEDVQDHEVILSSHSIRNCIALLHEDIFMNSIKQISRRAIQGVHNSERCFHPAATMERTTHPWVKGTCSLQDRDHYLVLCTSPNAVSWTVRVGCFLLAQERATRQPVELDIK